MDVGIISHILAGGAFVRTAFPATSMTGQDACRPASGIKRRPTRFESQLHVVALRRRALVFARTNPNHCTTTYSACVTV